MALRTVATKLKIPVASLKQAWAACRSRAKRPDPWEGLNVDPLLRQDMEEFSRAIRAREMKQTLFSIGFMGAFTGAFVYVLKSDLAAREALLVAHDSDQDSTGAAVDAIDTNQD